MQRLTKDKPRAIGNLLVTIMFASLGLVAIIGRDFIAASIWISLAATFASLGPEDRKWSTIPLYRRFAGLFLLGLSVALFGYQVGKDFADDGNPASIPASFDLRSSPVDVSILRRVTHA